MQLCEASVVFCYKENEGDIFRIAFLLDNKYSYDYAFGSRTTKKIIGKITYKLDTDRKKILGVISADPNIMQAQLATHIDTTTEGSRYTNKNLNLKGTWNWGRKKWKVRVT